MKIESGKPVALTIEKPVYGGDFLSHLPGIGSKPEKQGKAVFVPLTLPGERIRAQITEDKRNFSKAQVAEILTASPNRVAPNCRHFGACGGCHYQHTDYDTQLALKEQVLRETLLRSKVAIPRAIGILQAEQWGYRNRIRVAFVQGPTGLEIGYRSRESHDLVPIKECPIASAELLDSAEFVRKFLSQRPGPMPIAEMELFTNGEGSLLVTLFSGYANAKVGVQDWLDELLARLPFAAGLRLQTADGTLNPALLGSAGANGLSYSVGGFEYRVEHGAFFQVNHWLVGGLLELVTEGKNGRTAWDLFAGVGLFARRLTENFENVVAVEAAPSSTAALKSNLSGQSDRAVAATTVDFLRRNRAEREPGPDLIVLDPPRAGLGDEVTSLLNAIGAPRMVYVSCDPSTLARDLQRLTAERYRIDRMTQVDMFPQTFHIETVVELSRTF